MTAWRRAAWRRDRETLAPLAHSGRLELPGDPPEGSEANAHMFYALVDSLATRTRLIEHLRAAGILAVFHYVPLHSAPAGRKHGRAHGALPVTDEVSDRLVRLPLYYGITEEETGRVADAVRGFFG